ncbi:MAG: hypothetical protein JSV84_17115 [Gemmatimonadota bacterium]|nr:MAG: hypothetical protein JSV84_17115 [Gemmatimonadota bacterium]
MSNNISSIFIIIALLCGSFVLFIFIFRRLRKRGGSMATIALGATYELHGEDKKRAIEAIVERNAGDKLEEQSSSDPKEK